jgi:hypothetical protein
MVVCEVSNNIILFIFFNELFLVLCAYVGLRIERHNAVMIFVLQGVGILVSLALSVLLLNVFGIVK